MKLMNAFFKHAWFALSLKHDGAGLPTKLPAACMLIGLYITLNLANSHIGQGITLETLLGLSFIAQFYLFSLRTPLIGLFIIIGIITNVLTLALTAYWHARTTALFANHHGVHHAVCSDR
jgi:hypothetical protein